MNATYGERHRKILEYLTGYQGKFHRTPSIRQIGQAIGVKSTSLVDYYLRQLEELGYLERAPSRLGETKAAPLSLQVIRKAHVVQVRTDVVRIPFLGYISAGEPLPFPFTDAPDNRRVSSEDDVFFPPE